MKPTFAAVRLIVACGCLAQAASAATLLVHYNFDETPNGSAAALDLGTAPSSPGVFVGSATRTGNTPGGVSLGALDLTAAGAGTYLDGGDPDKLDGLSSFTLTAWINLQGAPTGNMRIMSKQGGSTFPGFSLNIADPITGAGTRTASNFGLRLFVGGADAFAFDATPTLLSIDADQKWAFIAVTYDGTSALDNVKYYVGSTQENAVLAATTTVAAGAVLDNSAKFAVGYTDAAPTADTAPTAFIDDVRVYNGTLEPQEVDAVRVTNIPEPGTAGFVLTGLAGFLGMARRRRRSTDV